MIPLVRMGSRVEAPPVPVEIADAVELWARGVGRHASIGWVMYTNPPTPQVRIELKPNDGRLEAWRKGEIDEKPVETVELVEWNEKKRCYVPLNLTELGASGVVELLEKGNMWTGRGEFNSIQEAVVAARERKQKGLESLRKNLKWNALGRAEERAYSGIGVPMIRGADLAPSTEEK